MNRRTLTPLKLAMAAWLATITGFATAGNGEAGHGTRVSAIGWYPADVIDRRGMERYTEAWYLEPWMNGRTAGPPAAATPAAPAATGPAKPGPDGGVPPGARPAGPGERP